MSLLNNNMIVLRTILYRRYRIFGFTLEKVVRTPSGKTYCVEIYTAIGMMYNLYYSLTMQHHR